MKSKSVTLLIYSIFLTATCLSGQDLDSGLNFRYDFSKETNLQFKGKFKKADGAWILDGKKDCALVPDSGKMNISTKGVTFAATVKLNLSRWPSRTGWTV